MNVGDIVTIDEDVATANMVEFFHRVIGKLGIVQKVGVRSYYVSSLSHQGMYLFLDKEIVPPVHPCATSVDE